MIAAAMSISIAAASLTFAESGSEVTESTEVEASVDNDSDSSDDSNSIDDSNSAGSSDDTDSSDSSDTFETSDKNVGEVEVGNFEKSDAPEVTHEEIEDDNVSEEVSSVDVTVEVGTDAEIEVSVDMEIVEETEEVTLSFEEGKEATPVIKENPNIIFDEPVQSSNDLIFESSDKIVGEIEIADFQRPEKPDAEPEVVPPTPVEPEKPEVVEPEKPQPEEPQPEKPEGTQPEDPKSEDPAPEKPRYERPERSHDDDSDGDITVIRVVDVSNAPSSVVEVEGTPVVEVIPQPEYDPILTSGSDLPKTGDDSVYGIIFMASGLILAIVLFTGKKSAKIDEAGEKVATEKTVGTSAKESGKPVKFCPDIKEKTKTCLTECFFGYEMFFFNPVGRSAAISLGPDDRRHYGEHYGRLHGDEALLDQICRYWNNVLKIPRMILYHLAPCRSRTAVPIAGGVRERYMHGVKWETG